jgi:hypothetical protein
MNYVEAVIQRVLTVFPGMDRDLARLYALLGFVKGVNTTLEDVHDAWAIWQNETRPDHKSLVEFYKLTPEVQELDRKYMQAIVDIISC